MADHNKGAPAPFRSRDDGDDVLSPMSEQGISRGLAVLHSTPRSLVSGRGRRETDDAETGKGAMSQSRQDSKVLPLHCTGYSGLKVEINGAV